MEYSSPPVLNASPKAKPRSKALLASLSDASDAYTGSRQAFPSTESSVSASSSSPRSPCQSTSSLNSTSSTLPLAPPLPFPLAGYSHPNPRETMRLAKLALMHEEVQEAEGRRERRRTRRASSLAAGMQPQGETRMGSRLAAELPVCSSLAFLGKAHLQAVDEDTVDPPATTSSGLHSILRSAQKPISPAPSGGSSRSSTELLSPPVEPHSPAPSLGARRRSSKVRFSEEPLASAHSSPPLPSSAEMPANPPIPSGSLAGPPSPTLVSRASIASVSSSSSDPFGLQCAYGSPVPTPRSPSVSQDMFQPRDLPYRRLSKVMARLNSESETLGSISSSGETGMSLREMIDRPSLVATASELLPTSAFSTSPSRATSTSSDFSFDPSNRSSACTNSLSVAADILSRDNSIGSAISSVSGLGLPPRLSASAGAPYASLLPNHFLAIAKTPVLNRQPWFDGDMGLSPRSGPISHPFQQHQGIMPAQPLLGERPEQFHAMPRVPSLDLKLPAKAARSQHADSIDMLALDGLSLPVTDALAALGIKPGSQAVIGIAGGQTGTESKHGHERQMSDISLNLAFPFPPSRSLSVSLAKLVVPVSTRRRASFNAAPVIEPVHALIEEYVEDGSTGEIEAVMRNGDGPESPVGRPESPSSDLSFATSIQTSPCPDAYSLSAAVMQVGSPLRGTLPIPLSPAIGESAPGSPELGYKAPDSPKLEDMIERTLRARRSTVGYNFDEEDSDLGESLHADLAHSDPPDTSIPLIELAVKHRIVSPNSRLIRPSTEPKPNRHRLKRLSTTSSNDLKSGVGLTRGKGWSGSEAEEEEWAMTIRSIALRRTSKPNLTTQSRTKIRSSPGTSLSTITASPRDAWESYDRYSSGTSSTASEVSGMTRSTSTSTTLTGPELLSPSASLDVAHSPIVRSLSPGPGRFPWGGSSPTLSPIKEPLSLPSGKSPNIVSVQLPSPLATPKAETKRRPSGTPMPTPKRDEEWGEPERMNDEADAEENRDDGEWPWDVQPRVVDFSRVDSVPANAETVLVESPLPMTPVEPVVAGQATPGITPTPSTIIPARSPKSRIPAPTTKSVTPLSAMPRIPTLHKRPSVNRKPSSASPLRISQTPDEVAEPIAVTKRPSPNPKSASLPLPERTSAARDPNPTSSSPSQSSSTVPSLNKRKPRTPAPPRTPSPPPDTLSDFVARARVARKLATTPSPGASPIQTPPAPASPIPTEDVELTRTFVPRLSLGARLAELIAKRDAAAARGGKATPEVVEEEVVVIDAAMDRGAGVEAVQEVWRDDQPKLAVEVVEPLFTTAPKGKQRQVQEISRIPVRRAPAPCSNINRFF